jgi:hypothetical protein
LFVFLLGSRILFLGSRFCRRQHFNDAPFQIAVSRANSLIRRAGKTRARW